VTESSKAVFLSYASQDAETAQRLCNALRVAGIEVWFDQSELRGGDAWDASIRRQIKNCALFIPVISKNTHTRGEGYFRLEWKLAVDRSHLMASDLPFLLPVVVDDTPDKEDRVPDRFREVQWTRLPGGANADRFVEHVRRLLAPDTTTQAQTSALPPVRAASTRSRPSASRSFVLWIVGGLLIVSIGYIVADKFLASKHAVPTTDAPATAAMPVASDKSIAVLPFTDMSERKDQGYFAEGMAEEIVNLLVKIPELKVIGQTSSFLIKGKTDDLRNIGSTLGAAYLVEGSVRRSNDRVRVTAQLIDTRDGTHRWAETYDRSASDILKVQGEIATSVVRALQLEVVPAHLSVPRPKIANSEAYDAYLRGLRSFDRRDQAGLEEAVVDFRHALELDPTFSSAADAIARAKISQAYWGLVPARVGFEDARAAAEAALLLNSNSPDAHGVLCGVYTDYDWNWEAAGRESKIIMALAPKNPQILLYVADERLALGQFSEAAQLLGAAIAADPLDAELFLERAWVFERLGRLAEAESDARRVLEIRPTFAWAHFYLGVVLVVERKADAAVAEMQKEASVGLQDAGLAVAFHAMHRDKDADQALARLREEDSEDLAMEVAEVYAFRGQKKQAFEWLERAFAQKDINIYYMKGDPLLKNLEGDSRYRTFLRKMNLPE
jgi:TolB-like protein